MVTSYAFVIFREMLEIILLLNLANINLAHVPNIKKINYIAILASMLFAIFCIVVLQITSDNIDIMFQEYVNIVVLLIGALCIIYNVIFAARQSFAKLKNSTNKYAIIFMLFSIIFREILEIIIFSYGFFSIKNIDYFSFVLSFMIGVLPAIGIGFIINKAVNQSLHKSKIKLLFQVTNFIMLLIASSFIIKIIALLPNIMEISFNIVNIDLIIYTLVILSTYLFIYFQNLRYIKKQH